MTDLTDDGDRARGLGRPLAPPRWLRDLGRSSWLIAGIALMVVATVWVLSLTQTIVMPLLAAAVVAAVTSPVVGWLVRRRVGRGIASALVLVGLIVLAAAIVLGVIGVIGGILSQTNDLSGHLASAKDTLGGRLHDLGVSQDQADTAKSDASSAVTMTVVCLLANGILQQLVQPIAYGAALGIHPLAFLIVTIGGGALFGAAGLILAAPLTSAITRIASDLAAMREGRERGAGPHDALQAGGGVVTSAAAGP